MGSLQRQSRRQLVGGHVRSDMRDACGLALTYRHPRLPHESALPAIKERAAHPVGQPFLIPVFRKILLQQQHLLQTVMATDYELHQLHATWQVRGLGALVSKCVNRDILHRPSVEVRTVIRRVRMSQLRNVHAAVGPFGPREAGRRMERTLSSAVEVEACDEFDIRPIRRTEYSCREIWQVRSHRISVGSSQGDTRQPPESLRQKRLVHARQSKSDRCNGHSGSR